MKQRITYHLLLAIFALLAIFMPEDSPGEPIDRWHWGKLSPEGILLRISYGDGTFIVVGEKGAIFTSADGSTWTPRSSGTDHLLYDAAHGSSAFVAVGADGTVLTSPDGMTWISRDSGTASDLHGVAYGRNTFVAVGDGGVILTSSDGAAWAIRDSGTRQALKRVVYGNNIFVAVGLHGMILTSPTGTDWTAGAARTSAHLESIAYGNGIFVAVGETILSSPDGIAWAEPGPRTNHHFLGVAYGSGTFVAVADNGAIFTSPDGSVWTPRDSGTHRSLLAIAYGDGSFIVTAENGTLLQSDSLPFPRISVSPTSLDFGSINVGVSSFKTLTITNFGSADLAINRLVIGGTDVIDFITQNDHCTGTGLPPLQHCTLEVVFSPHTLGSKSATLSIYSNDPASPTEVVPLSGSSSSVTPSSSGSFCFISLLADGSPLEPYIDLFRKFRDGFLLESWAGKILVKTYYRVSPSLAHSMARHDSLRKVTRWGLMPLAAFACFALRATSGEKALLLALIIGGMSVWLIIRKDTLSRKFLTPLSTRRNAIM